MTEFSALRIAREITLQEMSKVFDGALRRSVKTVAKGSPMTNMLTDRERELVEAARRLIFNNQENAIHQAELNRALRAYDPPKRKYTMPMWEEFVVGKNVRKSKNDLFSWLLVGEIGVSRGQYEAIREALSTEETA